MTHIPSLAVASHGPHLRAGVAAIALLILTSIHHAYGAYAFGTPWRLHILLAAAPAAILITVALFYGAMCSGRAARIATVGAAVFILIFPVAGIGLYEGGYNHVLKNLVYFIFGEAEALGVFPPPLYEMPSDFIFEATGVAQFPLSIMTAMLALPLLRRAGQ